MVGRSMPTTFVGHCWLRILLLTKINHNTIDCLRMSVYLLWSSSLFIHKYMISLNNRWFRSFDLMVP